MWNFVNSGRTKRGNDTLRYMVQAVMTVCGCSPLIGLANQRGWSIAGVRWSTFTEVRSNETDESHTNPSEASLEGGKTNVKDTQT